MDIFISLPGQTLALYDETGILQRCYAVSTARNGVGELRGSFRTPRGFHVIRAKIGAQQPENTVFVRRRPTGEIWTPELAAAHPGRDWILTRILWLSGCEPGYNRLGDVDTMRRYIYLHGSPDTAEMGVPGSIGCVRMRNAEIIELFDCVPVKTRVNLGDFRLESAHWQQCEAAARTIRLAVFVQEHGVNPALEMDTRDDAAQHVLAFDADHQVIGTGRLLADGETGRIGRLSVLRAWRGRGVGTQLLRHLLNQAYQSGMAQIYLHARLEAVDFYTRSGFAVAGEPFQEGGAPHIKMVWRGTAKGQGAGAISSS